MTGPNQKFQAIQAIAGSYFGPSLVTDEDDYIDTGQVLNDLATIVRICKEAIQVLEKIYVITIYDESAVVLLGDQVYNDGRGWTTDQVAEAIAHQLGAKVIHLDGTEIAEKNIDEWTWPDVIKEAIQ